MVFFKNLFSKIRSLFQQDNSNYPLDSKVVKEMAKKIAKDAQMHRKARDV